MNGPKLTIPRSSERFDIEVMTNRVITMAHGALAETPDMLFEIMVEVAPTEISIWWESTPEMQSLDRFRAPLQIPKPGRVSTMTIARIKVWTPSGALKK